MGVKSEEDFNLLDCHKGGLVTQYHSKVRDVLGNLIALGYRVVVCEPVVCEAHADSPTIIVNWGIRRVCSS